MFSRRSNERKRRERIALDLYLAVVGQARLPVFYERLGVADTVDGRFDLVVLHAFVLMRRLGTETGGEAEEARALSQALFDIMFADMDQSLREMGVSDISVGRKVKQMASAFYGRISVYESGISQGADALAEAIARNLYRTAPPSAELPARMAAYCLRQAGHLATQPVAELLAGRIGFLPPEEGA